MESLQNRIVDRKLINRGDLASCYSGRDARLDRTVFLKILNPSLTADDEIRARFEREAKAAARLDHPNLVHIHEFGEDPEDGLYMILEWVSGQSLRDYLKRGKTFNDAELLELAEQLLSGLHELHRAGILHRDVKPENILIGDDGRARITDFSLAALQGSVKLTHHQAIVGTPAYMSPEQAAGQTPDSRSDLFSVGVVLLELATGSNPFEAGELLESIRRVRELKIDARSLLRDSYSENLKQLISSCLEKNPKSRIVSAEAALKLIGKFNRSDTESRTKRNGLRWLIPTLIALVVIAIIPLFEFGDTEPDLPVAVSDSILFSESLNDTSAVVEETAVDSVANDTEGMQVVDENEGTEVQKQSTKGVKPTPRPGTKGVPIQPHDLATPIPDSVEISLTTEPWAHVMLNGQRIGTTPMKETLLLATGMNELTLQNPAYPVIMAEFSITDTTTAVHLSLADFVASVELAVQPWGEIYVDDEHRGTAPLGKAVYLLPGSHRLHIVHPVLPAITEDIAVKAGDDLRITVDMNTSELAVVPFKGLNDEK